MALVVKESACRCKRRGFNPWVRKIPWNKKWQPTPVFLPGKLYGQRSLVDYSPWGLKESEMTERLSSDDNISTVGRFLRFSCDLIQTCIS